MLPHPQIYTLFPYTTLFRSGIRIAAPASRAVRRACACPFPWKPAQHREKWKSAARSPKWRSSRSEEHTSELQSHSDLVCRLLLEKKKKYKKTINDKIQE